MHMISGTRSIPRHCFPNSRPHMEEGIDKSLSELDAMMDALRSNDVPRIAGNGIGCSHLVPMQGFAEERIARSNAASLAGQKRRREAQAKHTKAATQAINARAEREKERRAAQNDTGADADTEVRRAVRDQQREDFEALIARPCVDDLIHQPTATSAMQRLRNAAKHASSRLGVHSTVETTEDLRTEMTAGISAGQRYARKMRAKMADAKRKLRAVTEEWNEARTQVKLAHLLRDEFIRDEAGDDGDDDDDDDGDDDDRDRDRDSARGMARIGKMTLDLYLESVQGIEQRVALSRDRVASLQAEVVSLAATHDRIAAAGSGVHGLGPDEMASDSRASPEESEIVARAGRIIGLMHPVIGYKVGATGDYSRRWRAYHKSTWKSMHVVAMYRDMAEAAVAEQVLIDVMGPDPRCVNTHPAPGRPKDKGGQLKKHDLRNGQGVYYIYLAFRT